jgi:SAM-dependent methyltransferase
MKNSFHQSELWNRFAENWQFSGPPLRPGAEDIRVMCQAVTGWVTAHPEAPPRCLILGVTPEFAKMDWPDKTRLTAVDRNPAMIEKVWPGYPRPGEGAVCGDWCNLPLPEASIDIVLGDGCFTVIDFLQSGELILSIKRVLCNEGILILRLFVRPQLKERPEAVMGDLLAGRIGSFHAFRWRLNMSLYDEDKKGVHLGGVWDYWHKTGLDNKGLAERMGWLPESIALIDLYRGSDTSYFFPTVDELRAMLDKQFNEVAYYIPTYELGERCPIVILRPKA